MALVRIRQVVPLDNHIVRLVLTDGRVIERDLMPLLAGPVFEEISNDPARFREVRVESGALTWPNGADLCPDAVIWGGLPPVDAASDAALVLLHRQPRQKQAVRLHIFPIGNEPARDFAAVAPEQLLQLRAGEPALPLRRFQSPQCSAFLSMIAMRPPGFTTRHISPPLFRSPPRAPAIPWRRPRRTIRLRTAARSSTRRASEFPAERIAASPRKCPGPRSPPPGSCSWKMRAKRPLPQPTSRTRLPRRSPRCSRISFT